MAGTTQINISGSGFFPSGAWNMTITTSTGAVTSQAGSADSSGNVSMTIPIASINGISGATSLQMQATDLTQSKQSNTVTIPIQQIVVNPVLVAPSGPIVIVT